MGLMGVSVRALQFKHNSGVKIQCVEAFIAKL